MKNFLAGLWEKINSPGYSRPLMIILPCFAVLISLLIVVPPLNVYMANMRAASMPAVQESAAAETPVQTGSADTGLRTVRLTAYSQGEDLFITVCGENGEPVTGERFQLTLTTPLGDEIICSTYTDGSCYLVELLPGNYTVTMQALDGYTLPEPVICAVSSATHQAPSLEQLVPGLNEVDGKLYYLSELGQMASAVGVDLSCYNGRIEWDTLRNQGISFVILRVGGRGWGTGMLYTDTRFRQYFDEASRAGLKLGVYFYSTAVNDAEAVEEAEYVLSRLYGAPLDMPVFLDIEYSGKYPYGRADRLSTARRSGIINAFSSVLRSAGYDTGVYSGTYYITSELNYRALSAQTLWIANYTANNMLPRVSFGYDIWQYTESGRVKGVFGPVDINVIF